MITKILPDYLEYLIEPTLYPKYSCKETLVIALDLQCAFTKEESWISKNYFGGQVSGDEVFVTKCWDYVMKAYENGASILAIKLVHDIQRMKIIDNDRYDNQKAQGLISENGEVKLCAPGSPDTEFDFGHSLFRPPAKRVMEKCTRDLTMEREISSVLLDENKKNIVLIGVDSNVCIYESALGILNLRFPFQKPNLIIPIDAVSTRPSDFDETKEKFQLLKSYGVTFSYLNFCSE